MLTKTIRISKRSKVCQFKWVNKTGDYDPVTGRYDGAIGLLTDGLADIFIRPLDYGGIDTTKFVDFLNSPFMAIQFSPFQLIGSSGPQIDKGLWNLYQFLMPSTSFVALFLAGCLLYLVATYLLSPSSFSLFKKPTRSSRLKLKLVFVFFLFFLLLMHQFFESNLNTENVIVETNEILYSEEKILRTKKEFCFMEKGEEMDYLKNV